MPNQAHVVAGLRTREKSSIISRLRLLLALLIISPLIWPNGSFGQAPFPALGAAADFALFTASGAFGNTGATFVQGNIGTGSGAFSGFPPGTVTGTTHVADTLAGQAAADVQVAFAQLAALPCGTTLGAIGGPADTPQVLTPGVYCLNAATSLSGSLILDGQGDSSARFVFQIGGALTVTQAFTVKLSNTAALKNVYWQVGGIVELEQNSVFHGTLLVNGAIQLGNGATLYGRALSRQGEIMLNTNTVRLQEPTAPLPVTLTHFAALRQGSTTVLSWATASEVSSHYFTVERRQQASDWQPIGTVPAAGNSTTPRAYRALDHHADHYALAGVTYYRLRSTDQDGSFTFSEVRVVSVEPASAKMVAAFPNPVAESFTVTGIRPGSVLTLIDVAGRAQRQQQASGDGHEQLNTEQLLPGIYLLQIVAADGHTIALRITKL